MKHLLLTLLLDTQDDEPHAVNTIISRGTALPFFLYSLYGDQSWRKQSTIFIVNSVGY
jgi:hypothetical protein